jgi:hypothetical protein
LSHWLGFIRHYHDGSQRENVTDERHVRRVLRRNRFHHSSHPNRGKAAGEPRAPPCARSGHETDRVGQQNFLLALRGGDFEGLIAVLDPDVIVRADSTTVPPGPPIEIRGARNWARGTIAFAKMARSVQPMLVDGSLGLVWAPGGRLSRVLRFTVTGGKIVQAEVIANPERLSKLDLAVLDE